MTHPAFRTQRSEVSKDSHDDQARRGMMIMANSLVSYTKNVVGHTRYSTLRVTLFRFKNPSRYVSFPILSVMSSFVAHYTIFSKAWTFLREFVLGDNKTGLVTDANTPAVGGEDPKYAVNTLAEGPEVYQGSYTTTSTYYFPTETVARWDRYVQESSASSNSKPASQISGASGRSAGGFVLKALASVLMSSLVALVWLS